MRRCKRGVKEGQGQGQGSNLRGTCRAHVRFEFCLGRGEKTPPQNSKIHSTSSPAGPCSRSPTSAKQEGVPVPRTYSMNSPKVDLSYHGYRSSGSDVPAPTQATLHMRACASQGPTLECGLSGGLSARRGGRTRGDARVRARWGRTRSKTGHQLTKAAPRWG